MRSISFLRAAAAAVLLTALPALAPAAHAQTSGGETAFSQHSTVSHPIAADGTYVAQAFGPINVPATAMPQAQPAQPTATPTPTPTIGPVKEDGRKGLWIIVGIIVAIVLLNWLVNRKEKNQKGKTRVYHGDPEDYPRPRGRILTSSERRDMREQYRDYPYIEESYEDEPDSHEYRVLPKSATSGAETDPMKPKYERQSNALLILPSGKDKKTFADVAGQPEAISRLKEVCLWLKEPEIYNRHNAKLPRGILLVGPPGTGKTLCAQAIAGETHGSMFSIAASSFVEMYVGVGASRVRALFADAKAQRKQTGKPVIIFIDELDAVGGARGRGSNSNTEREQTLNQLLVEMDGFSKNEGIIIVAATNRPDMIDAALRRKGRFDLEVYVDQPDLNGREAILGVHTRDKVLAPEVDFKLLARRTFGMSGADLAAACNEAAIIAAREQSRLEDEEKARKAEEAKAAAQSATTVTASDSQSTEKATGKATEVVVPTAVSADSTATEVTVPTALPADSSATAAQLPVALPAPVIPSVIGKVQPITTSMFDEAISIVEAGDARRERFKAMSTADKKQTAVHELGHAIVIHKTGGDPITKITILPRGRALGYVQTHTEGDRWNMNKQEMLKRITAAMAGRIAQELLLDTVDTGASNDFEQANQMARKMVTIYGMSPLGMLSIAEGQIVGPSLSDKIDVETAKIVSNCADEARKILEASRHEIEALVDMLLEKETIFGSEFVAVLEAKNTPVSDESQGDSQGEIRSEVPDKGDQNESR